MGGILVALMGVLIVGCSSQTKVVYKEPKIVLSKPYELRDGSRCRDIVIYREEGREAEVKTLCVR